MGLTALDGLSLAWSPDDSAPGSGQRSGTLTVRGIAALPVLVEWGDGDSEIIHAQEDA